MSGLQIQINTFWLVLGYVCNNRCSHCYASSSKFISRWMDVVFAKEVMKSLKEGGAKTCLLIGGEPTLYPHLLELISYGSEIGLKMVIVTNGRKLKSKKFTKQLFAHGLERAVVSLEGADAETHNFLTGRDSFSDTVKGIRVCAEIGQVNTLTTICRTNSHQIVDIIKFAYSLGVKKAVLNCAIPVLSEEGVNFNQSLSPSELAEVIEKTFWQLRKEGISFQLNATFPLCLLRRETLLEALYLDWISVGCHMYRGKGVVFDPNGNILPCTHFTEAPLIEGTMGECGHFKLADKFVKFWSDSNSVAGKFRAALWRYPAKNCEKCEYWGACIGGCPLLWTYFDPIYFIDRKEVSNNEGL